MPASLAPPAGLPIDEHPFQEHRRAWRRRLSGESLLDLFAFGLRFQAFFSLPGRLVIIGLASLLMSGWLLPWAWKAEQLAAAVNA
jgi:hypothetical protein